MADLKNLFVRHVYADHNSSRAVKENLRRALARLEPGQIGLNIGAGGTVLHPRVKNLDIRNGPGIDCVASAENLPFGNDSIDLIVTQETLEHVADPFRSAEEIARVLKPGGMLYCQLPFIIGFHPGPRDYWRFSVQGICNLVQRAGLEVVDSGIAVGGATGYYRVSVEFWSILFSMGFRPFYKAFKAFFALVFFPVKWLDGVFNRSAERDRIAGGYFVLACKRMGPVLRDSRIPEALRA